MTTPHSQENTSSGNQGSIRPHAPASDPPEPVASGFSRKPSRPARAPSAPLLTAPLPTSPVASGRIRKSDPPAFHSCAAVTTGSVSINDKPIAETTYRTSGAPFRRPTSSRPVMPATSVPCQMKCSNAQPIAWAPGSRKSCSIALITDLPSITAGFDQLPYLAELLLGRPPGGQRLHHELRSGAAKCSIEQVADELALRLLLSEPRLIDVGSFAVVAPDEPLLRHDLQHLQCGGIRRRAIAGQLLVHLTNGAGAVRPEDAQDCEFSVSRTRGLAHGIQYVRTHS